MSSRLHIKTLLAAALALAFSAGCTSATLKTPGGFATLEDQKEYVYRSANAEGVVIAIRSESNKPKGNLDFWADALDRQLRRTGYVADGKTLDVRAASGQQGKEMKYTREENGRTYRFWLAVFVTDNKVWMVETGGDAERMSGKIGDAVQRAIESFTLN